MKIGWTVKKLSLGVFFSWKFPWCSPKMKFWVFWCFSFVPLIQLNRLVYYLWKSVQGLKIYWRGYFFGNSPIAPLKWNSENFWCSHMFTLVELNWSVYCTWESVERVKSYSTGCFGLKSPLGAFFQKKCPLEWILGNFVQSFEFLSPSCADWANVSRNRMNGSKVIHTFV